MPGLTGMLLPQTPRLARASKLGVLAASNSVGPPGCWGSPPRPSATSMTIFELFFVWSWRVSSWISMAGLGVGE